MLSQASKVTGIGLIALLGGALVVPGCDSGGSDDDDDDGGSGGSIAGGSGGSSAGTTHGGSTAGGSGPGGATGTYACQGVVPPSTAITDFTDLMPAAEPLWGAAPAMGAFYGGLVRYGAAGSIPVTDVSGGNLHVTGTIKDYSGAGLYVSFCTDASKFAGVRFKISGDTGGNKVTFLLQTNKNLYPDPMAMKGECLAAADKKFIDCIHPGFALTDISADEKVVELTWDKLKGGLPTSAATTDGSDVVGFQWSFPWAASMAPYDVDLTIDDVEFIGEGAGGAGAGGAGGDPMGGAGGAQ